MRDAVRPSKEEFDRVFSASYNEWSSHLRNVQSAPHLPPSSVELQWLLNKTPSFLGYGLISEDTQVPFNCVEKESSGGQFGLLLRGQSTWTTSHGPCSLEPKTMPLNLLLAVPSSMTVKISESTPLGEWPGVDGISDHDEGNYISVLFLAWAYILSARWAESLKHASGHQPSIHYKHKTSQSVKDPRGHEKVEIDIGRDIEIAEAAWWRAILCPGGGWNITTEYKEKTYHSPWSIILSSRMNIEATGGSPASEVEPPSSSTALEYLASFCSRQSSTALAAALYIPFLSGGSVALPLPRPTLHHGSSFLSQQSSNLIKEYSKHLSNYMTLSCNVWGMRSLLASTFFNENIECNLVSAWLNPTFALVNSLIQTEDFLRLAKALGYRQPKLSSLWLGAILMGVASSTLRNIRAGLTAMELNAAARTETQQSFTTAEPGVNNGQMIHREDECRLLFITACDGYTRPPVDLWKPFGETRLLDAELTVQQHADCRCHCLNYDTWNWNLQDGDTLRDPGLSLMGLDENNFLEQMQKENSLIQDDSNMLDQELSELATRGIFGWLRSTGYPANERPLYQHSWFDIGSSDEENENDIDSDIGQETSNCPSSIIQWLNKVS